MSLNPKDTDRTEYNSLGNHTQEIAGTAGRVPFSEGIWPTFFMTVNKEDLGP